MLRFDLPDFGHNGEIVEGVGFEPTGPLRILQFSRLALSTAQPPLQIEIPAQPLQIEPDCKVLRLPSVQTVVTPSPSGSITIARAFPMLSTRHRTGLPDGST
jgi:hypothetical protein